MLKVTIIVISSRVAWCFGQTQFLRHLGDEGVLECDNVVYLYFFTTNRTIPECVELKGNSCLKYIAVNICGQG